MICRSDGREAGSGLGVREDLQDWVIRSVAEKRRGGPTRPNRGTRRASRIASCGTTDHTSRISTEARASRIQGMFASCTLSGRGPLSRQISSCVARLGARRRPCGRAPADGVSRSPGGPRGHCGAGATEAARLPGGPCARGCGVCGLVLHARHQRRTKGAGERTTRCYPGSRLHIQAIVAMNCAGSRLNDCSIAPDLQNT